jgi:hypothetical protein
MTYHKGKSESTRTRYASYFVKERFPRASFRLGADSHTTAFLLRCQAASLFFTVLQSLCGVFYEAERVVSLTPLFSVRIRLDAWDLVSACRVNQR